MSPLREAFEGRKHHVRRAYENYQQDLADEEKVKRELEILMHVTWANYDDF